MVSVEKYIPFGTTTHYKTSASSARLPTAWLEELLPGTELVVEEQHRGSLGRCGTLPFILKELTCFSSLKKFLK